MSDIIGFILITVGILFNIFGCVGLVRFPDVYNRLQAATKCVTLGTVMLLVGVAVTAGGPAAAKAVICAIFILVTSPTAAHAIAKGSHISGVRLWDKSVVDKYAEEVDGKD
ncbi:MAG: Na+/H+ antiporter subunit G [Planctomycetota bacterium]|nr:MAG: Na+/H+ antiporter subunit G [Planctomycetota bacterium]